MKIMNQKMIKLLNAYASKTDQSKKEIRKWWNSLSWEQKTQERKKIQAELAEE